MGGAEDLGRGWRCEAEQGAGEVYETDLRFYEGSMTRASAWIRRLIMRAFEFYELRNGGGEWFACPQCGLMEPYGEYAHIRRLKRGGNSVCAGSVVHVREVVEAPEACTTCDGDGFAIELAEALAVALIERAILPRGWIEAGGFCVGCPECGRVREDQGGRASRGG